jgi:hypothetical protein
MTQLEGRVTHPVRLVASTILVVVLTLSSTHNAFAAIWLGYDSNLQVGTVAEAKGSMVAVRFAVGDFAQWPRAMLVAVSFFSYSGTEAFRVHIFGNLHTGCAGTDLTAPFDVSFYQLRRNTYEVWNRSIVVSEEFCVAAEWLTDSYPIFGSSNRTRSPYPPHSYYNVGVGWTLQTSSDFMIRASVQEYTPANYGFVEALSNLTTVAPWLVVIGLVACAAIVVLVRRKRRPKNL